MVTSPGWRFLPAFTSSSEGLASAIHISCWGFIQTPILGFEGWTSVDVVDVAILDISDIFEGSTAFGRVCECTTKRLRQSRRRVTKDAALKIGRKLAL